MKKLQLLEKIQKLAAIVHCQDLKEYHLTDESLNEMRKVLDDLTDRYIAEYCQTSFY